MRGAEIRPAHDAKLVAVSKRNQSFERHPRDFYKTPQEAVIPLIRHLPDPAYAALIEPCAGDAALVHHLEEFGYYWCITSDIEPQVDEVERVDVMADGYIESWKDIGEERFPDMEALVVTNPPWDRKFLHPFMDELIRCRIPAWLLFDADWMHTKQAKPYENHISKIVSVGRVKWIEGSKSVGFDNVCWYLFEPKPAEISGKIEFCMR